MIAGTVRGRGRPTHTRQPFGVDRRGSEVLLIALKKSFGQKKSRGQGGRPKQKSAGLTPRPVREVPAHCEQSRKGGMIGKQRVSAATLGQDAIFDRAFPSISKKGASV